MSALPWRDRIRTCCRRFLCHPCRISTPALSPLMSASGRVGTGRQHPPSLHRLW
jgi:hypothetical protein